MTKDQDPVLAQAHIRGSLAPVGRFMLTEHPAPANNPMRLTPEQRRIILDTVRDVLGADAAVRLFGSRTDDTQRGGDIDLLVETDLADPDAALDAKLDLLVSLKRRLGERRIDILFDRPGQPDPPPVVIAARATGIPL